MPEVRVDWVARVMNAFVLYLAWVWSEFSLTRPVEIELSVVGLADAQLSDPMSISPVKVVQPAGVQVNDVAVTEEVLPWELLRAPVRHRLLRRLCDRLEQAFGHAAAGELFETGFLYGHDRERTGHALSRGMIWDPQRRVRVASVDAAGQIHSATTGIVTYLIDGVIIDDGGDTVAVLEMPLGSGCPEDFLPDVRILDVRAPQQAGIEPDPAPSDVVAPIPTARWSNHALKDLLV
jgi:hypothetical protein